MIAQNRNVSRRLIALGIAVALASAVAISARAQATDPGAVFRVFLVSGEALPSYGEAALVGDRVVFTLLVGAVQGQTAMQLMSLPRSSVDLERTIRYARAIRGRHYASTRGEVDYAAMRL